MGIYKDKRVTIMGLGLFGGGLGVTRYFCREGARVLVTDLSSKEKLSASLEQLSEFDIKYKLGYHDINDFTETDIVVVNPAVPLESPYLLAAREAGVELETELNLFMRLCKSPIAGITGANGKSTTTSLSNWITSQIIPQTLMGGNIGKSLLDMLDVTAADVPVILELSSFQLENLRWLKISPKVSVITNITPNHLDRHKTMEGYIEAKRAILDYQKDTDFAILNADDEETCKLKDFVRGNLLWFSRRQEVQRGAFVQGDTIIVRTNGITETICPVSSLALKGAHNIENALAAILVSKLMLGDRWNRDFAVESLSTFRGLPHRLEFVREYNGVRYYNDSIATNPASVIVALEAMAAGKVLIAGGYDKKLPFDDMAKAIYSENVRAVVLIGETRGKIKAELDAQSQLHGFEIPVFIEETLSGAVSRASNEARWGDLVFLSPGCASYGMFVNFEQRGREFTQYVNNLGS